MTMALLRVPRLKAYASFSEITIKTLKLITCDSVQSAMPRVAESACQTKLICLFTAISMLPVARAAAQVHWWAKCCFCSVCFLPRASQNKGCMPIRHAITVTWRRQWCQHELYSFLVHYIWMTATKVSSTAYKKAYYLSCTCITLFTM